MPDDRPDIEEVFEHYGSRVLPGSGQWQKAECPLLAHEDNNPSASVNVEAGKWQCWSCDQHGDVYDIVIMNEENCAGLNDARAFCKENFAAGSGDVRPEPGYGGGLSVRPRNHPGGGKFVPAWRRL